MKRSDWNNVLRTRFVYCIQMLVGRDTTFSDSLASVLDQLADCFPSTGMLTLANVSMPDLIIIQIILPSYFEMLHH